MLLTRDKFRESVFKRDNYKCVICGEPAKDAHHIIERRLFIEPYEKGGYFLNNGASLCEKHHIEAEKTLISCEEIRDIIGIKKPVLPDHFYDDFIYDKWGNIILPNGNRLKGELFYDESVQKILKDGDVLHLFVKYVKYPRTYHLPHSTLQKDDRKLEDDSNFIDKRVICSLKMDGENCNMYNDFIHARSINSGSHPTRDWVKGLWGKISYLIDENMRICGENLYAKHSIKYNDLPTYFMVFSIWIENKCLSWDETSEYCKILGIETVPVIYDGIYDKKKIEQCFESYKSEHEGYVIRIADEFNYADFKKSIAKYVQLSFRQTVNDSHGHWISKKIEKNNLIC